MRKTLSILALLALAAASSAQNLVQNPGFETGNLNGWTGTGGLTSTAATGDYAASLAVSNDRVNGPGSLKFLRQTAPIVPGSYQVSFWLSASSGSGLSTFGASLDSSSLLDLSLSGPSASFDYRKYSFLTTITSASPTIVFEASVPTTSATSTWTATYRVDDVSVTPVPEPSALAALGLGALALLRRRARR